MYKTEIRNKQKLLKYTDSFVSDLVGISVKKYRDFLHGEEKVSKEVYLQICGVLGVQADLEQPFEYDKTGYVQGYSDGVNEGNELFQRNVTLANKAMIQEITEEYENQLENQDRVLNDLKKSYSNLYIAVENTINKDLGTVDLRRFPKYLF